MSSKTETLTESTETARIIILVTFKSSKINAPLNKGVLNATVKSFSRASHLFI